MGKHLPLREDVENRVREIIVEQLAVDPTKVTMEANIVDDLGADSLDEVELMLSAEEEFNFRVDEQKVEKIKTVKDMVDYIVSCLC